MPLRLLLVDDHEGFRRKAGRTLAAGGFDVIGEARDGAGALEAVRELDPDVVLLDIGLPDMSGLEVAATLARERSRAEVVLVSTRDAADYGDLLSGSGARGFLSKAELSGEALAGVIGPR